MAIKACTSITLFHNIDIIGTTYYYKLISTLTTPNVPDDSVVDPTTSAGGNWSISEPSYIEGSTSYLYYTIQTKFSDGTQTYSYASIVGSDRKACLSSSYEAAKAAYNKAVNAQNTANAAEKKIYHTCSSSGGTAGYFYFARCVIIQAYANKPITFSISNRGIDQTNVELRFANLNGTDPSLTIFKKTGKANVYIIKADTSTWDLYVQKTESYDQATFTKFSMNGYDSKFTWTWKDTTVTELPSGYRSAGDKTEIIVGTQTGVTGSWTGVASFDQLIDGQEISYWLPYNGSGNATLNLTLSNGSTTGAINCYYSGANRLATHYAAGNVIHLTYRVNANVAGTNYTGWWADANYDTNTYDRLRFQNNIRVDQQYIQNGRIIAAGSNNLYNIIKSGAVFKKDSPILFAGTALGPAMTGNNNYIMYSGINITNNLSFYCDIGTETITSSTKGYVGTGITGNSTTATVFSGSGVSSAVVGDLYINTSTYYLYKCTTAGNASTAKWVYIKSLYTTAGKRWYNGNKITHTTTTETIVSDSGISSAAVGDYYFNTSSGGYYKCTVAGNASTAKWLYKGVLIESYKTIYLRCTLNGNLFTVDEVPFTTTIPVEEDGLYYISLGTTYGLNAYGLFPEHPIFRFIDGEFKSLDQVAYEAQENLDSFRETYSEQYAELIRNKNGMAMIVASLREGYYEYSFTTDTTFGSNKEYYEYVEDDFEYKLLTWSSSNNTYTSSDGTIYSVGDTIPSNKIYKQGNWVDGIDKTSKGYKDFKTNFTEYSDNAITTYFGKIREDGTSVDGTLASLKERLENAEDILEDVGSYIKQTTYNNMACIEIGSIQQSMKVRILPDRIGFFTGEEETAYISNNALYITESTILVKEQIGHWITEQDNLNNLNTKWVN